MNSLCLKSLVRAAAMLALFPLHAFAINTDVVIFKNGDRLTGELKSLERAQLRFKTDATGTISIEWGDVAFLSSTQNIQAETISGVRYFGTLTKSETDRTLVIVTSRGPIELEDDRVVKLTPIDEEGWRGWDIDVSAGYNFTSANAVTSFNVGASASHRTRTRIIGATFSSVISDSSDSETSQRENLGFNFTRLRADRWLNSTNLDFTRNDELGIQLRTSLGAGIGRILTQSNRSQFIVEGGLKLSQENLIDVEDDTTSIESYGLVVWDWYRYDSPEWDLSTDFELIPSITEWGRVRAEFSTKVKWEIVGDLFWLVELYDSFDSAPQTEGAANHDYGVITSVTYDF